MDSLSNHIDPGEGGPTLRPQGVPIAEVMDRLTRGGSLQGVRDALDLTPTGLLAALAYDALGPDGSEGPGLVQAPARHPELAEALSEPSLAGLFLRAERPARLALAAGLLQIHDHWEASHHAAQEADDLGERAVSAYWHGIAHRREPDPGNAAYWFRRVGRHALFPQLAEAARPLLDQQDEPRWSARLLKAGAWEPSTMIDLCASARPGSPQETLARRLQRMEMAALLAMSVALVDP